MVVGGWWLVAGCWWLVVVDSLTSPSPIIIAKPPSPPYRVNGKFGSVGSVPIHYLNKTVDYNYLVIAPSPLHGHTTHSLLCEIRGAGHPPGLPLLLHCHTHTKKKKEKKENNHTIKERYL